MPLKPHPKRKPKRILLFCLVGGSILLALGAYIWASLQLQTNADSVPPRSSVPQKQKRALVKAGKDRSTKIKDSKQSFAEKKAVQPPTVSETTAPSQPSPLRQGGERKGEGASTEIHESFDKTPAGGLPTGWRQWSNNGAVSFAITTDRFLSTPNALASSGGSAVAARVWLDKPQAADIQASAAVFLNSLIPGQVLVRGTNLDTPAPGYYAVSVTRGLEIQLVRVLKGAATTLGSLKSASYFSEKWARLTLRAEGKNLRVQVERLDTNQYLNDAGQWQPTPAWTLSMANTEITEGGQIGLGRTASYAGKVFFDDFAAGPPGSSELPSPVASTKPAPQPMTPPAASVPDKGKPRPESPSKATQPPPAAPADISGLPRPNIPRHYPHIRIALLAYYGNPMGTFEDRLLKESVDLVIPHTAYLKHIEAVAPQTPKLIYTNTSNLYQDLLTDWLTYADKKGIGREAAFYHAAIAKPFRGNSPSSQPVTWFWGVYCGGPSPTNFTGAAHSKTGRVPFGAAGEALYLGYPDRFREINFKLDTGAGAGWSANMEYASAVDDAGSPATWAPLRMLTDSTSGLKQSGQVTFHPPADWKAASVGGSARLFYVRFRTARPGSRPVASSILGRDFVGAKGSNSGTIPAFDAKADANHDGYLDDAEYANRAPGMDARFLYESRMLTESYGQMRFCTNPSSPGFRDWAVDHHLRLLKHHALANGLFMDNSEGKVPVKPTEVLEPLSSYASDYGEMLNAISRAIAPRWILPNTVGGGTRVDPIIKRNPAYFEEFAIRPLVHHHVAFEDLAGMIARRAALTSPAPIAVIDSHPQKGTPDDPRMQLSTLAYYYLLADPESTYLMFYGGFEPGTSWTRHWSAAVSYDIGQPSGKWSPFATGPDPASPTLNHRIYQRPYEKALVLYKPLSYARGAKVAATSGDETATKHELSGTYRPLQPDGTLGEPLTSVSLRNGEGAILIAVKP